MSDMCKNCENVIIKLDNCQNQYKNWTVFSNFLFFVNEPHFFPKTNTLDFLKPAILFNPQIVFILLLKEKWIVLKI